MKVYPTPTCINKDLQRQASGIDDPWYGPHPELLSPTVLCSQFTPSPYLDFAGVSSQKNLVVPQPASRQTAAPLGWSNVGGVVAEGSGSWGSAAQPTASDRRGWMLRSRHQRGHELQGGQAPQSRQASSQSPSHHKPPRRVDSHSHDQQLAATSTAPAAGITRALHQPLGQKGP